MPSVETEGNGEASTTERRNARLKNWGLLLGGIAAVATAVTSMFNSLGVDNLINNKHAAQTEANRKSYEALKAANEKLLEALRIAFERIRSLEDKVSDLKENERYLLWMRLTSTKAAPRSAEPPDVSPMRTSDPEALLGDEGGILSRIMGKPKDRGLELLNKADPPEWSQVQKVAPVP